MSSTSVWTALKVTPGTSLRQPCLLGLEDERVDLPLLLRETAVRRDRPADVRRVAADPGPDVEDDEVARRERARRRPEMDVGRVRAGGGLEERILRLPLVERVPEDRGQVDLAHPRLGGAVRLVEGLGREVDGLAQGGDLVGVLGQAHLGERRVDVEDGLGLGQGIHAGSNVRDRKSKSEKGRKTRLARPDMIRPKSAEDELRVRLLDEPFVGRGGVLSRGLAAARARRHRRIRIAPARPSRRPTAPREPRDRRPSAGRSSRGGCRPDRGRGPHRAP